MSVEVNFHVASAPVLHLKRIDENIAGHKVNDLIMDITIRLKAMVRPNMQLCLFNNAKTCGITEV